MGRLAHMQTLLPPLSFHLYEVRSETKLAFRVVESLFRFVSLCTEFVSSTSQIISSLGRFVSSPMSSSRRQSRSSRRDQTCRHLVRLVDSWDDSSRVTRQVQSSSRRTLGSNRRELIGRDCDRIVRRTWKMKELRGMLESAINKVEAISSTPTPNDNNNNNNNPRSTSSNPVISRAEANWRWGGNSTLHYL